MSSTLTLKKITNFNDMFQEGNSLWIINSSDLGGKRPKGNVIIVIKDADSQDVIITLPSSWVPVDLLSYTSMPNFAKSNAFRDNIRKGLITVLDDASAQQLMKLPQYAEELKRVKELTEGMTNSAQGGNGSLAGDTYTVNIGSPVAAPDLLEANGLTEQEQFRVQDMVKQINGIAGDMTLTQIRSLVEFLTTLPDRKSITTFAAAIANKNSNAFVYIDKVLAGIDDGQRFDVATLMALDQNSYNQSSGIDFNIN